VDAQRIGALGAQQLISRLLATVTTTTHPPAPIAAMLTEIVAHQEDICQPLDISSGVADEALVARGIRSQRGFPLGSRQEGRRLGGSARSDLK